MRLPITGSCRCGHPREMHRHNHHAVYCGRCRTCNRYSPVRQHWWQIWRTP